MTSQGLVFVIALAAGPLAVWSDVRFGRRGPRTITATAAHMACSTFGIMLMPQLLVLVVGGSESPMRKMLATFGVLLPLMIYAWLATIWMLKMVQRAAHQR